jgi:hypothetical protein
MTSREHARRLMLILLASEGSALRKAADERLVRREGPRRDQEGLDLTLQGSSIAPGHRSFGPAER